MTPDVRAANVAYLARMARMYRKYARELRACPFANAMHELELATILYCIRSCVDDMRRLVA